MALNIGFMIPSSPGFGTEWLPRQKTNGPSSIRPRCRGAQAAVAFA
jgi:hypothetical protein